MSALVPSMSYKVFKFPNYAFVYTRADKGYTFNYEMVKEDISLATLYFKGSMIMTECDAAELVGTIFTGFMDWRLRPDLNTLGVKETCLVTEDLEKICVHPKPLITETDGIVNLGVKDVNHAVISEGEEMTIFPETEVVVVCGYIKTPSGDIFESDFSKNLVSSLMGRSKPYIITGNAQLLFLTL